jgi:uncharacterized iron-regulated membrane protein
VSIRGSFSCLFLSKTVRKKIWQLHSWIGLACALALLVIGLTGSVLVFHEEITDQLHPELKLNAPVDPGTARLPVSELTRTIEERFPEFWIRGWLFKYENEHRDRVYLNRRDSQVDAHDTVWFILHVDPYTAESGEAPIALHDTLYGWFVDLHYTFFADHIGMALAGVFALGFLFLGFSGIYMHRPFFKTLFRLRWGASLRILFSDVHKAVGIATIPMNLILGFTGAYWNITHLAHEIIEHHEEDHEIAAEFAGRNQHLDALHDLANETITGYSLNYAYFPTDADPTWYLYGQHPDAGAFNSPYGSSIFLSAETGEVTASADLRKAGWWAQVVDTFEPLHFGHFGGLVTQIIWCLAGLAPAILSFTGVFIFFRRRRNAGTLHS